MLLINNLLIIAAGIAVTVLGRTGTTSAVAYVQGQMIPDALFKAQLKAEGIPLD